MRVLFTSQPGAGHWRPLAPLAEALETAGHAVAFATTPASQVVIAAHGFRCFTAGSDDTDEETRRQQGRLPRQPNPEQAASVWANVFAGTRAERSLPDLLVICRDWRPDVIVREASEFGGCLAAECLGLPHAAVQVSAWRPHLHALIAAPLNRLRRTTGLPSDPDLAMLYRYLLLTPTPTGYRDPTTPLPPTAHGMRYVSYDRTAEETLPDAIERVAGRPTVYATLGTAYNRVPDIFRAIIEGLRAEPLTLVLTVGPDQDPARFEPQPPNVFIAQYIPHSLLFPRCDLVISHGGFGTIMAALGHGLPLIVVPIAADQPDNARRCAALGVARVIAPDRRTPVAIREAALDVLCRPTYRANAAQLRGEMKALPGLNHAVGLLERLAVKKRPLLTDMNAPDRAVRA
jgi:UDP:flavonoid glycosyltransferase YjiC (YdhE family)